MTTQPTKRQKLRWLAKAQIYFAEGHTAFSCNAMHGANCGGSDYSEGESAEAWYVSATAYFIGREQSFLFVADFDHNFLSPEQSRGARALWLAMLETLVRADEI